MKVIVFALTSNVLSMNCLRMGLSSEKKMKDILVAATKTAGSGVVKLCPLACTFQE